MVKKIVLMIVFVLVTATAVRAQMWAQRDSSWYGQLRAVDAGIVPDSQIRAISKDSNAVKDILASVQIGKRDGEWDVYSPVPYADSASRAWFMQRNGREWEPTVGELAAAGNPPPLWSAEGGFYYYSNPLVKK